jgi:hypothetical protein
LGNTKGFFECLSVKVGPFIGAGWVRPASVVTRKKNKYKVSAKPQECYCGLKNIFCGTMLELSAEAFKSWVAVRDVKDDLGTGWGIPETFIRAPW